MYEIIERSMKTGAITQTYGPYLEIWEADAACDQLSSETEDYWYEVRRLTW